ncbi:PEP-CTERM sorting domain-containing protein [bacterium]|nr:PEP-CTERM sorting domain-containing protein [bacterium]
MRIRLFTIAVFAVQAFCFSSAGNAADLYDNLGQPVSVDGNFSDGTWPALSFKTTLADYVLDSVTIPIRNPNLLSSGTISFVLYDSTGVGGGPGAAVGSPLGSVSIAGISGAGYQNVTFAGLKRTLTSDKHYWVAVQGAGLASVFYVGATTSTGGNLSGSLGFSISSDAGASWSAPSTSVFVIGQVNAVPEPSTYALGAVAALTAGWLARRKRSN